EPTPRVFPWNPYRKNTTILILLVEDHTKDRRLGPAGRVGRFVPRSGSPMPEHWIRLRGGWEWHVPGAGQEPRRVTLPLAGFPGGALLVRSFQKPPLDLRRETLWLRLDAVPGLVLVALNGRELVRDPSRTSGLLLR